MWQGRQICHTVVTFLNEYVTKEFRRSSFHLFLKYIFNLNGKDCVQTVNESCLNKYIYIYIFYNVETASLEYCRYSFNKSCFAINICIFWKFGFLRQENFRFALHFRDNRVKLAQNKEYKQSPPTLSAIILKHFKQYLNSK